MRASIKYYTSTSDALFRFYEGQFSGSRANWVNPDKSERSNNFAEKENEKKKNREKINKTICVWLKK